MPFWHQYLHIVRLSQLHSAQHKVLKCFFVNLCFEICVQSLFKLMNFLIIDTLSLCAIVPAKNKSLFDFDYIFLDWHALRDLRRVP